jgi:transcriptional regulator with XRE-family HTH domain
MAVAEAMGLTFQQLQKYEHGANRISASLSQLLDVDIAYFFDEIDSATQKASPAQLSQQKSKRSPKKPSKSDDPLYKRETLELVRAYYRITEPTIRTHVRKLVQFTAASGGSS